MHTKSEASQRPQNGRFPVAPSPRSWMASLGRSVTASIEGRRRVVVDADKLTGSTGLSYGYTRPFLQIPPACLHTDYQGNWQWPVLISLPV